MDVALNPQLQAFVSRLIHSGKYGDSSEVIEAGLRRLQAEEETATANEDFPAGSLIDFYTADENAEELEFVKGAYKGVEEGF